jgi:hypothetical protein
MQIVLENKDLEVIDKLIQETPFKYAQPLFQFFSQKIQQAQQAAQVEVEPEVDPTKEATEEAKVKSLKKK